MSRHPNILWIVVDDLRADRCGCYGYDRPTTPHMDQLAENGLRFDVAIAQGGYSLVSYPTMLTGLYPSEHGVFRYPGRLDDDIPRIAQVMARTGYRTGCIGGNPFFAEYFGLTNGFQHCWNHDRVNVTAPRGGNALAHLGTMDWPKLIASAGLSALGFRDKGGARLTSAVHDFIVSNQSDPWFCFVHYMEVHSPYWPPLRHRLAFHERWSDGLVSPFLARYMIDDGLAFEHGARAKRLRNDQYDAEVAYCDALMGQLLERLAGRNALDNTIVIICSDHGEYLGEKGLFRHAAGLGEILVRVPLIVYAPDHVDSGRVKPGVAELRDIPHTLCKLFDTDGLAPTGRRPMNLLSCEETDQQRVGLAEWRPAANRHRTRSANYNAVVDAADRGARLLRDPRWEYLEYEDGEVELFDMEHDALETTDLSASNVHVRERLRKEMETITEGLSSLSDGRTDAPMPEAVKDRLKNLGYL